MTDADDIERDDIARVQVAERLLGFPFNDRELLRTALTHPSHDSPEHEHYERLEFLGDSVLGILVTEHLFRTHPELSEGRMTKIRAAFVSGRSLAGVAETFGLAEALIVGPGAESVREQHTPSLMADSLEALLAAVYLDQGIDRARQFLFRLLDPEAIEETIAKACEDDPKNLLQEHTQAQDGSLPEYRIVSVDGPPHDRTFTAEVVVDGQSLGKGVGSSKKEAQRLAADQALKAIEEDPAGTGDTGPL